MVSTTTSIDTVGVNLVILIGEVTSPPVQRTLQTGEVVSSFDLATHVEEGEFQCRLHAQGNATPLMWATTSALWALFDVDSSGQAPA